MNEQPPFTAYSAGSIAYSHKQTDYVTPHSHDHTEVVYYISGKGLANIYGETLYNFRFDEDSIVVIPPHRKHDEYSATETEIVCNQVDVEGDAFAQPHFFKKTAKTAELFGRIKSRMLEINRLYCGLKTGPDREAEVCLDDLLSRLGIDLCCLISQSEKGGKYYYTDIVTAVKSYIRKHFAVKIDFSILAESFGYSYDRFRHIFYEYTGMTLYAFQQGLRFNYAKQQLAVSDMKIAEIAAKTGLGSSVRFCEWFGKMAGVSPLKYRDMNKRLKWGVVLNLSDIQEKEHMADLILDTDLGCDCDDAAAIAIVNVFHRKKMVNVLCMTQSLNDPDAARAIGWINGYYGNDFDIGVSDNSRVAAGQYMPRYVYKLRDEFDRSKKLRPAVRLMQEKLHGARSNSVTMVFIGQLNNLAKLLSTQEGETLVREKAAKIVIMGGNFSQNGEYYLFHDQKYTAEFNIGLDVESAQKVTSFTDLPLEFIDFNQGLKVLTGGVLKELHKNPVTRIYELFGVENRESWDIITVLYAMLGGGGMFAASEYGTVHVNDAGVTTFCPGSGRHRLLELRKVKDVTEQINEILIGTGEVQR